MNRFKVASRLNIRQEGEKCPRCLDGWVDFMVVDEENGLLGCYKCGSVFVSKAIREEERVGKKEQLARQVIVVVNDKPGLVAALPAAVDKPAFICTEPGCGKAFTVKVALIGHMRSHKANGIAAVA